jgi:hypothetical protein
MYEKPKCNVWKSWKIPKYMDTIKKWNLMKILTKGNCDDYL